MGKTALMRKYIPSGIYLQDIVASETLKTRFKVSLDSSSCSGFGVCSGARFCSGCKNVRVFSVRFLDFVRVFSVENLWRSLGESLLKSCGKVSTSGRNCEFCTLNGGVVGVFHGFVEKFSYGFSTWINRGKMVVLHSFHRLYYNYYYYIREFLGGTAEIGERIRKVNI